MSWQFRGRPALVTDMLAARQAQTAPASEPERAAISVVSADHAVALALDITPVEAAVRAHTALATVRCGCWPRYIGRCYCTPGGTR